MAWSEIPLTNVPFSEQMFKLTLDGGARNIHIKLCLRYHDLCDYWTATVIDYATGKTLIDMLPLVCGIDLLGQFKYLDIGSAYVVKNEASDLQQPDNTTLGSTFILVWGDDS